MADLTLSKFRAGDTFKLTFDLESYPAGDGWEITYILAGTQNYSVDGEVVDGQFEISAAPATTENWAAGNYTAFAQVEKDGEKYTIELGQTQILAGVVGLTGYDGRSHVKKVLDALEALIEGKASSDVDSYSIAGRQLTKMKPDELLKWLTHYKQLYKQELAQLAISQGQKPGNTVVVRF